MTDPEEAGKHMPEQKGKIPRTWEKENLPAGLAFWTIYTGTVHAQAELGTIHSF